MNKWFITLSGIAIIIFGILLYFLLKNNDSNTNLVNSHDTNNPINQNSVPPLIPLLASEISSFIVTNNNTPIAIDINESLISLNNNEVASTSEATAIKLNYKTNRIGLVAKLSDNKTLFIKNANNLLWNKISSEPIIDFTFTADGQNLFYLENTFPKKTLNIISFSSATSTQNSWKKLALNTFALEGKIKLTAIDANNIFIETASDISVFGNLLHYKVKEKTLELLSEKEALNTIWNELFDTGLEASFNNGDYKMNLINNKGVSIQELDIKTFINKCAFESINLYCAIPKEFSMSKKVYENYIMQSMFTNDELYKINTRTGEMTILNNIPTNIDITNILIKNNILYFIDRKTNLLFGVKI